MSKREIWNSLGAGWRRAFRKTMRRWMKHIKEGGYWTGERMGCYLCAEAKRQGGGGCVNCPVDTERDGVTGDMWTCACENVSSYALWSEQTEAHDNDKRQRKPLREARAVLRYLCGFPPASDKTRQAAEELLARRKR